MCSYFFSIEFWCIIDDIFHSTNKYSIQYQWCILSMILNNIDFPRCQCLGMIWNDQKMPCSGHLNPCFKSSSFMLKTLVFHGLSCIPLLYPTIIPLLSKLHLQTFLTWRNHQRFPTKGLPQAWTPGWSYWSKPIAPQRVRSDTQLMCSNFTIYIYL